MAAMWGTKNRATLKPRLERKLAEAGGVPPDMSADTEMKSGIRLGGHLFCFVLACLAGEEGAMCQNHESIPPA